MGREYVAYIDEAGDEGFGKLRVAGQAGGQSRWLAIGCCIVSRQNDGQLPKLRDKICDRFPHRKARDLHFRDLSHEQKVVACQEISGFPLGICVTLSNKATIPGSKFVPVFKQKGYLYNYLVRWLLERITAECSRAAKPEPCRLTLVFSRRGGTDYHSMTDYLRLMRDGRELMRPVRSIDWRVLNVDDIVVEDHSRWAGLQIADCVTSALWSGLEPNGFGNRESRYAEILKPRLLHKSGNALNAGLVPVPSWYGANPTIEEKAFLLGFSNGCGQAPGS